MAAPQGVRAVVERVAEHAAIVIDESGATIEDLQSKNGTRVDGLRVTGPTRLPSGCRVSFGAVEFVYARTDPTTETHTLA